MASSPVTINIKVSEDDFVRIARALKHTRGVLDLDYDLDPQNKGKGLNGATMRAGSPPRGALRMLILRMLFDEPKGVSLETLREAALKLGFSTESLDTTLYRFVKANVAERTENSWYRLTAKARKQMSREAETAPKDVLALPPPDKKPVTKAYPAILHILFAAKRSLSTKEVRLAFLDLGFAERTLANTVLKAMKARDVKAIKRGLYELTAKGRKTLQSTEES